VGHRPKSTCGLIFASPKWVGSVKKLTFAPVLSILNGSRATLPQSFYRRVADHAAELARLYPWLDGMTPICCKKPSTSFSDHFSVGDPVDRDRRHFQIVAGTRRAREIAFMLPDRCKPDNYFIAIGNLLFDAVRTRSRLLEHAEDLLQPFAS
jgi:hypothetical protein